MNIFPKGGISKNTVDKNYNQKKIQPFLDFVRSNLCFDEDKGEDQFRYIMWWIAHLLRCPQDSQSVVLVLWGKQGTGKNVFSSTIGRCFCSSKFYTGLRKSDIVGGYNDFLSGTFLVVCDEISETLSTENWSIIKSITASDRVRINPKFGKVFSAIVRTRFIFTSNPDPLWGRSSDNRRILKFETQKNFTDFGTLIKLREDPEFIEELCKYFNSIDLSEFEPSVIPKDRAVCCKVVVRMSIPYLRTALDIPCIPEARSLTTVSMSTLNRDAMSFAALVRLNDSLDAASSGMSIASANW